MQFPTIGRRGLLTGAAAAAATVPLAACAGGSSNGGSSKAQDTVATNDENPFGLKDEAGKKVEAVIFNGGYGVDYVEFAAKKAKEKFGKVEFTVKPSTQIAQELQPRFVGKNPPDLIDNSGAGSIGFQSIVKQLDALDAVLEAKNYEGTKIADTLYPGVKAPGTYNGKFVAMNYVMSVYALWYSASLFEENGWKVPTNLEEAYELGTKAKAKGKYLFVFGKEAATYYQTTALMGAIRQGGPEVLQAIETFDKNAWSHPAITKVLKAYEKIIKAGMVKPGGSGTQFTAAQAQWSNQQAGLLYPSGAWIENEMKDQTKKDFKMTGTFELAADGDAKLDNKVLHAEAGEPFIIPSDSASKAGGMELMRAMLSKDAAENFAKTKLAPTIVKGTVAEDGYGSTALVSQNKLLADAGTKIFGLRAINYYGTNKEMLGPWNKFLEGNMSADDLAKALQQIFDKAMADTSVQKLEFTMPEGLK